MSNDHISLSTIAIIIYISLLTIGTCLFTCHCYRLIARFLHHPTAAAPPPPRSFRTANFTPPPPIRISAPPPALNPNSPLLPRSSPAADFLGHDVLRRMSWLEASSKNHVVLTVQPPRPGEPTVAFDQFLPRYSLTCSSSALSVDVATLGLPPTH